MKQAFTFDDVLLVPQYSDIKRGDISLESLLYGHRSLLPIISSPMDTVTEIEMMKSMIECGGKGVHHRYGDDIAEKITKVVSLFSVPLIAVSPSMDTRLLDVIQDMNEWIICFIDVAHGHTKKNLEYVEYLRNKDLRVVSGNIATKEAARDYYKAGVRAFRVGIGGGSACSTRLVTGVGVPQLSAVSNIYNYFKEVGIDDVTIISDGGHKTTGDIVKSLRFGADYVMLGGMLAGHKECPIPSLYRGMASESAQESRGKKNYVVEGKEFSNLPIIDKSVKDTLKKIEKELRLAFYYLGASNIEELRECDFNFVTNATLKENTAHYGK